MGKHLKMAGQSNKERVDSAPNMKTYFCDSSEYVAVYSQSKSPPLLFHHSSAQFLLLLPSCRGVNNPIIALQADFLLCSYQNRLKPGRQTSSSVCWMAKHLIQYDIWKFRLLYRDRQKLVLPFGGFYYCCFLSLLPFLQYSHNLEHRL